MENFRVRHLFKVALHGLETKSGGVSKSPLLANEARSGAPNFVFKFVFHSSATSRIVESCILAVRGVAGLSSAEVAGGDALAVALVCQQFDEPGFVFDFFVQNARSHIVGARIFAEGHVADLDPTTDGAAFRLQEERENVYCGGRI